ncbi:molecular chaperone DnaJ [Paenibacillus lentus]|uniref:Molecular chaperone DnaJ n=1 Tax=Paenibacillus lentus TaxID=1338368 RepID=A0A3Q8S612_9BACL|nr:molecular chaperone DnaJ [Paenibacillus lentus]AZK47867.1 molecular chaperone DnaJ [Paenibacillus lentus]
MDELKKAYEQLGLPENASREEVEQAFDLVLRKSRSRKGVDEADDYERSLQSYKLITEHEDQRKIEQMSQERYAKWGKFAGTAEKIDDFFRIYRTRVIIGIIAIIVLIFGINAFVDYRAEQKRIAALPPLDLSVLIIGNFAVDEMNNGEEALKQAILAQFPEWNRVDLQIVYVPEQGEMVYRQKAMAVIATEKPDLYIIDRSTFDWISGGGGFKNLQEESNSVLSSVLPDHAALRAQAEEDPEPQVYAVDLTASELADQLPLAKKEMIAALGWNEERYDNTLLFIKRYLENMN